MSDKKSQKPNAFNRTIAKITNIKVLNLIESKLLYIIFAGIVFLGDSITKTMATALHESGKERFPLIEGFIDFVYLENPGMAAGKLSENRMIFIVPSVIAMLAIFLYLMFDNGWKPSIGMSLSMMLGGGIGNLVERMSGDCKVVDFIFVVPFDFFPFTCVFNVADVFVCVSAGILIFELLKSVLKDNKKECTGIDEDLTVSKPRWIKFLTEYKKEPESKIVKTEESKEADLNDQ